MCCAVLKCIKCSATVRWLWWSCKAYILQSLCDKRVTNGIANIKLYNMVMCSGDGLVMTQSVRICTYLLVLMQKCDGLNVVLLDSSCELSIY